MKSIKRRRKALLQGKKRCATEEPSYGATYGEGLRRLGHRGSPDRLVSVQPPVAPFSSLWGASLVGLQYIIVQLLHGSTTSFRPTERTSDTTQSSTSSTTSTHDRRPVDTGTGRSRRRVGTNPTRSSPPASQRALPHGEQGLQPRDDPEERRRTPRKPGEAQNVEVCDFGQFLPYQCAGRTKRCA